MYQKFQIGDKIKFVGNEKDQDQDYLFLIGSVGVVVAFYDLENWDYKIRCNNVEYLVNGDELEKIP